MCSSDLLANRGGQIMRPLSVTRDGDGGTAAVDVPLAGLAAGEYSVQWRAVSGSAEVRETVPFRVTP